MVQFVQSLFWSHKSEEVINPGRFKWSLRWGRLKFELDTADLVQ